MPARRSAGPVMRFLVWAGRQQQMQAGGRARMKAPFMVQSSRSLCQNHNQSQGPKTRLTDDTESDSTESEAVSADPGSTDHIKVQSATESTVVPIASWNRDQVALSKFFSRSSPLVVPKTGFDHWLDALLTPVEAETTKAVTEDDGDSSWEDIPIDTYNDEYAKIFDTFNPFTPPISRRAIITNPSLSRHRQLYSEPEDVGTSSQTGSSELDRFFEPLFDKKFDLSKVSVGPAAARGMSRSQHYKTHRSREIVSNETFSNMEDLVTVALQRVQGRGSVGRWRARADIASADGAMDSAIGDELSRLWAASSSLHDGFREGDFDRVPVIEAISIKKRRRQKMNKHKWKKQRRLLRDSTRYNKERRKKSGPMREKQE